jgi:type IV fimbrial biogenesis protein FimT
MGTPTLRSPRGATLRCAATNQGLTLIEVMVGLAIAASLLAAGVPYFVDYTINARLREAGHQLQAQALLVQREAIKQNLRGSLTVSGSQIRLHTWGADGRTLLTESQLPQGVTVTRSRTVIFGSDGRPWPFGAEWVVDLQHSNGACSADRRCPSLRVDAGGVVRLCPDRLESC